MAYASPRRIVVWADGSAEAAHAAGWAAAHAAARALPLHLLHAPQIGVLADAGGPRSAGGAFAARNHAAVDVVLLAKEVRRIRDLHRDLAVSVEAVKDGAARPDPDHTEAGDVLVTGPGGFLSLFALVETDWSRHECAPVPFVVVPDTMAQQEKPDRPRVLLVTGTRLSCASAAFAFEAAADLGASLDVVRVSPQDGAFGDDYWIDVGRVPYRTESRLQNELAKLRALFPAVPGTMATLRTRPLATMRTMARGTHLAVVGNGPEAGRDLRALLGLGLCPVAVVPEA